MYVDHSSLGFDNAYLCDDSSVLRDGMLGWTVELPVWTSKIEILHCKLRFLQTI